MAGVFDSFFVAHGLVLILMQFHRGVLVYYLRQQVILDISGVGIFVFLGAFAHPKFDYHHYLLYFLLHDNVDCAGIYCRAELKRHHQAAAASTRRLRSSRRGRPPRELWSKLLASLHHMPRSTATMGPSAASAC